MGLEQSLGKQFASIQRRLLKQDKDLADQFEEELDAANSPDALLKLLAKTKRSASSSAQQALLEKLDVLINAVERSSTKSRSRTFGSNY